MKIIKYFILSMLLFAGLISTANAATSEELYKDYCPIPPYDLSGGGTRAIQKITGINLLASKIAANEVKKSLTPYVKGKLKVKVKTFSATDAQNGKFKSFEIKGQNLQIDSVYISDLHVKTACDFIHLDINKNPVVLKEPMAIDFQAKFSEKDLNSMLNTSKYKKYLVKIKYNTIELKFLELRNPHISLKDNKFHYSIGIKAPFVRQFIFHVVSDLQVRNNKIFMSNMNIGSTNNIIDIQVMRHIMNILNPLSFAQVILSQQNCQILLKGAKIYNGEIVVFGSVFLDKN